MVSLEFRLHPMTSAKRGHWASAHGIWLLSLRGSQIRCHRTGGLLRRQPVLSIVCQASMALCLSIRCLVWGIG